MSTRIYNMGLTSPPLPGPSFLWSKQADGTTSGRHTFTLVRGAMAQAVNQARFKKGAPITSLDPTLPSYYSFLQVESFEAQDLPGGYEEVSVTLAGLAPPTEGESESDRERTYASDVTLTERSILAHPDFIKNVTLGARRAIARMLNGFARGDETLSGETIASVFVYDNVTNDLLETISEEVDLQWYQVIFIEGHRTYLAPHYEWQKSTANAGGLNDTDLAKLGRVDPNPDGAPPKPPKEGENFNWLKTRGSDSRSSSSASTEEAWQYGDWPKLIYGE